MTFDTLRKYNRIRDKEFKARKTSKEEWNIVDRSNELAGEVGEICNLTKKVRRAQLGMQKANVSHGRLAEEIADAVICLDLLSMDLGIDLSEATPKKFNSSSDKFGLKTKMPVSESDIFNEIEKEVRYLESKDGRIKKVQVLNLIETKRKELEGV